MRCIDGKQFIVVAKTELMEVLMKNRGEHRRLFEEACEGFRKEAMERIEAMLADAKAGKDFAMAVGLPAPVDHTREYDRAIKALTMTVDTAIHLTEQDFTTLVMDDWQWKRDFLITAASYSAYRTR